MGCKTISYNNHMSYQGSCTWLCIFQSGQLVPLPQSHHQTLRRWPGRGQVCFHLIVLHQGCRKKKKKHWLPVPSRKHTAVAKSHIVSVEASLTCGHHERHCYWMCEFCSAVCPPDLLPQPAKSAAESVKENYTDIGYCDDDTVPSWVL